MRNVGSNVISYTHGICEVFADRMQH